MAVVDTRAEPYNKDIFFCRRGRGTSEAGDTVDEGTRLVGGARRHNVQVCSIPRQIVEARYTDTVNDNIIQSVMCPCLSRSRFRSPQHQVLRGTSIDFRAGDGRGPMIARRYQRSNGNWLRECSGWGARARALLTWPPRWWCTGAAGSTDEWSTELHVHMCVVVCGVGFSPSLVLPRIRCSGKRNESNSER